MNGPHPVRQSPETLHCRIEITAGAKSQRCKIPIPARRRVRACGEPERAAGHCAAAGKGRYVAWAVGTGPGHCRITKKKTKWDRAVSAKLSKSEGRPSTCDLYVMLE